MESYVEAASKILQAHPLKVVVATNLCLWAIWWKFVLIPASRSTSRWGPKWLAVGLSSVLYRFGNFWMTFSHDVEEQVKKGTFCSETKQNYMIVWHPHGMFTISSLYFFSHFWAKEYPEKGWFVCVAPLLLNVPGLAEFLLLCGARSSDRKTFGKLLKSRRTVGIQPGGLLEQVKTDHEREVVYFPGLGFIKTAIENGTPLLPCYAFGENQLYWTAPWVRKLNYFFYRYFKTGSLVVLGQFGIPNTPAIPNPGMLPRYKTGVHMRYGEPVDVGQADPEPDDERINEVFERYVKALTKLFDAHKDELLPKEVAAKGLTIERPPKRAPRCEGKKQK